LPINAIISAGAARQALFIMIFKAILSCRLQGESKLPVTAPSPLAA